MIARVPFESGSLIGNWTGSTYATWAEGLRAGLALPGERFAQTLQRVEALEKVCAPCYPTLAEAALRYALSSDAVSTVIPGMLTPAEIDTNEAISDGAPLSDGAARRTRRARLASQLLSVT
jgi:aryl-alcohol dehydrogenase-like predicted oxidoreductase